MFFFLVFIIAFCKLINPLLALKELYFILLEVFLKMSARDLSTFLTDCGHLAFTIQTAALQTFL